MINNDTRQWEARIPVPPDAPDATFKHHSLGMPDDIYEYRTRDEKIYGYICRFTDGLGQKKMLPRTYGYWKGSPKWAWKGGLKSGRPLFNACEIDKAPLRPILIVEGEKTVKAAKAMLPEWNVLCSMGGAEEPSRSDWSAVKGKSVTIWPDYDPPGKRYGKAVADLCERAGAAETKVVSIPPVFPEKWDLADSLPHGVTIRDVLQLLKDAKKIKYLQIR